MVLRHRHIILRLVLGAIFSKFESLSGKRDLNLNWLWFLGDSKLELEILRCSECLNPVDERNDLILDALV